VVLGPIVMPLVRPLAKSVVKVGLLAYDQGRVALSELNERTGDIVAEARAEMQQKHDGKGEGGELTEAKPSTPRAASRAAKPGPESGGAGSPAPA
jgi:hypothetical protein